MKLFDLRAWGLKRLKNRRDVDILLMEALGISQNDLLTKGSLEVDDSKFMAFARLYMQGMPLQYILGRWEFMGLEFHISQDVLIPRADTEILVETILQREPHGAKGLEIGIGSGCISISLAHHGSMDMTGTDICPRALEIAKTNNRGLCNFVLANLFPNTHELFDFIVSNPPYISTSELANLDSSVKDHEPLKALNGGADGLDFYRRITAQAGNWLAPGGRIYFEIGYNQGQDVKNILKSSGFSGINIIKDLSGHGRVVYAKSKE
jgi:release factor glutamine methyltransferase